MKDFCKWLGVNEKIAKIVVWLFIFICMLIIFNAALDSFGLPYYRITAENLSKVKISKIFNAFFGWITTLLNFYSIILIPFRFSDIKSIFKWSILYLVLNVLISILFNSAIAFYFIIIYVLLFSYLFSNKNSKYVFLAIVSFVINTFIQYICYLYKIRFIDMLQINYLHQFLLSLDYFAVMFVIIIIKEQILRKRGV